MGMIPAGVLDIVWELNDKETDIKAFMTIQIILDDIIQPNDILKYRGTVFEWNNDLIQVMVSPNEHMVVAYRDTIKTLEKTCKELDIDIAKDNIHLVPVEEFKRIFETDLKGKGLNDEEISSYLEEMGIK